MQLRIGHGFETDRSGRSGRVLIGCILLVSLALGAGAQTVTPDEVVELVTAGQTRELRQLLSQQQQTVGADLAQAVLEPEGLEAAAQFQRLTERDDVPGPLKAIAWFHLYGHARLSGNDGLANEALEALAGHPEVAERLFQSGVPEPLPEAVYQIQIGAFGSVDNANRLAARQRERGFTVSVEPSPSGDRTLQAVRVGRFPSRQEAISFGNQHYGDEGVDFRIVEVTP